VIVEVVQNMCCANNQLSSSKKYAGESTLLYFNTNFTRRLFCYDEVEKIKASLALVQD